MVIALASSKRKLTKEQIRTTIVGYAEAPNTSAFERMFERDKEELRLMGVPIITEKDAYFDDDIGYRIDKDAYALEDIEFTPSELAVLSVAASVWSDAALGEAASRGLTKLKASGAPIDIDATRGLHPQATAASAVFGPLYDAVIARQNVSFNYRAASTGQESTRKVQPWRLLGRSGTWYLVAHDLDRGEPRIFRLSRITTSIRKVGRPGAYHVPNDVINNKLRNRAESRSMTAHLWIAPDRAHQLRERALDHSQEMLSEPSDMKGPSGYEQVSVSFDDVVHFARQVVGHGPDVVVAGPPELRTHVIELLRGAELLDHVEIGNRDDGVAKVAGIPEATHG